MTESLSRAREQARALIQLGRYDQAVLAARDGLAAQPDDPALMLLLAVALSEADPGRGALDVAKRAVALQPESVVAHRTLGWLLFKNGRGKAADHLVHAISLDPHDVTAHVLRAEMLLVQAQRAAGSKRVSRRFATEAETHAAEVMRLNPAAAAGRLLHAKACLIRGEAADSEAWARKALSLESGHPGGHRILGLVAQLRGETQAAADHFLEAGKLEPTNRNPIKLMRQLRSGGVDFAGRSHLAGPSPLATRVGLAVRMALVFVVVVVALVALGASEAAAPVGVTVMAWYAILKVAVGQRWKARRSMSDDARRALARDRELRGWRRYF